MSYQLEWIASPNFTPGSQTQAYYGQPRSIQAGAGHWWNTPEAGATHDGVVSMFQNAARQVAAHAVVSAGRVTEMVRDADTAWATNNANPYVYAIECDPRIMWKWQDGVSQAQRDLGNAIFETIAEYIADKRYHSLPWYPHNHWFSTQCNPIHWNEVAIRAAQIRGQKDAPAAPPIKEIARENFSPVRKLKFTKDVTLQKIPSGEQAATQVFKADEQIDIAQMLTMSNGSKWYRTSYSASRELATGFPSTVLVELPPPDPEWIKNLEDITDVKLMVLNAAAPIIDLNKLTEIGSPIPKGTWIDIAKKTKVAGKTYLISNYSVTNGMANGIPEELLGIPAPVPNPNPTPPKPAPEPSWLDLWQDIADINMYTRKPDVEVVNLLDGSTTTTIKNMGTMIAIASATDWMGQKYCITKYSTDARLPHGIRLVDLDIKPVLPTEQPADPKPPAPEKPAEPEQPAKSTDDLIRENNSILKQIWDIIKPNK